RVLAAPHRPRPDAAVAPLLREPRRQAGLRAREEAGVAGEASRVVRAPQRRDSVGVPARCGPARRAARFERAVERRPRPHGFAKARVKVRLEKRDWLELGAVVVSVTLLVLVLLVMADVHCWDGAITRGDARFVAAPPPQPDVASGLPSPPPARWRTPTGLTADVAERLLG